MRKTIYAGNNYGTFIAPKDALLNGGKNEFSKN
jgi:hypothetical protein